MARPRPRPMRSAHKKPATADNRNTTARVQRTSQESLAAFAPAKVNLTLRVLRRRVDGYHEIESLVAFADLGDDVTLNPGKALAFSISGPTAAAAGPTRDKLILKAAQAFASRLPEARLGRFHLVKRLPAAAGLGGGSADAAAALRMLARANHLPPGDPRLLTAAAATGADVPVCLDPRPRVMRGIGEILSEPVSLPQLPAVLVNPGVPVPTRDVFAALSSASPLPQHTSAIPPASRESQLLPLLEWLSQAANDLEPAAIALQPVIADALAALRGLADCRLARMSGSGATCFGLFESADAAAVAVRQLEAKHSGWWVRTAMLGGQSGMILS